MFCPDCFETIRRHGGLAVEAGLGADLFAAVLGVAEVFDLYLIIAARRDDDIIKFLGLLDLADGADAGFLLPLDRDGRYGNSWFWILRASDNLGRRDVVRTHLVRIDPDVYLPLLAADDRDLADAVDRLDAFLDLVLGDLGDFAKRIAEPRRQYATRERHRCRAFGRSAARPFPADLG